MPQSRKHTGPPSERSKPPLGAAPATPARAGIWPPDPLLCSLLRREVVDSGVAPGATAASLWLAADGWRGVVAAAGSTDPTGHQAVTPSTVYDLASVTKPILAATIARLVRAGTLRLDTPVSALLDLGGDAPSDLTVEALLSHRAGLPAHLPLFEPLRQRRALRRGAMLQAAASRRADCAGPLPASGFAPVYSDLGYLLLGEAAARSSGLPLDVLLAREVAAPLGLAIDSMRRLLATDPGVMGDVAASEAVGFRGRLQGVVHDENAWAIAGHGAAGHAGLFGRAGDVARFGAAMLDALAGRCPSWLDPADAAVLVRERLGGTLRAGFDGVSPTGSSAGRLASSRAFGHLGFTGTSLWCDPAAEQVVVLLSNRVCPSRDNTAIRAARPRIHDALLERGRDLRREHAAGDAK